MITLTYTINGARFRRGYSRSMWRSAILRARILRDSGIPVVVRRTPAKRGRTMR